MPEYTVAALTAVVLVLALELLVLRTGLLGELQYWLAIAIVTGFQVPVDGWLTKLNAPIVLYDDRETLGVRFPWDIPVEDFAFGFAMVTLALLVWRRLGDSSGQAVRSSSSLATPESRTSAEEET